MPPRQDQRRRVEGQRALQHFPRVHAGAIDGAAEQLVEQLDRRPFDVDRALVGGDVVVGRGRGTRAVVGTKEVFRVRVGPFETLPEAEKIAAQLRSAGYAGAWIAR